MKTAIHIRSFILLTVLSIVFTGTAAAIQQGIPDADNQTGTWSTIPLFSKINTPGDTATFVTTTVNVDLFEVSLNSLLQPSDDGAACNLIITNRTTGGGAKEKVDWAVLDGDGGAVLINGSYNGTRGAWSTDPTPVDLSTATGTPPTSWANIAVTITSNMVGGETLDIAAVHLECLDGADVTPPNVSSTVPTNGATGIALNAQVTINWDENIDCTTVNTTNITSNSPTWTLNSCSGSTAVFDTGGQANSTTYNVNVTTAVTDLAGNPMSAAYPFSYTTLAGGDVTPPAISSTVPADGATDVALNAQVTINWDENIDCTTVNTTSITSDSPTWTLNSCSGSTAVFDTGGQANSTTYNVNVTTAVTDLAGNPMSAAYPFSYTTAAADITPPGVTGTVPTNGATGIALNAQVTISWDENIDCATVNTTSITSNSPTWTLNSCSGSTAVFDTGAQTNSTTYNVNVTTAVTDLAGNPMSAAYPFSYDTAPPGGSSPVLSATTVYWFQINRLSSVKDTTAKLGATIDADGGAAITERGIVWSTSDSTPTIGEPGVTKVAEGGTATTTYSDDITALPKASLIYFSGYATNSQGTNYSPVSSFYTEPDTAAAPTVDPPTGTNYFELTVNYTKPANADGVVVVVRPNYAPNTPPYDGMVYSANSRVGSGDTTDPGCIVFCDYIVADDTASGSVTVTGLKDNLNHYFAVYAYKGSGSGITGINYVQTINATGPVTTDTVPAAGKSHNELYVAQGGAGGTMTSADCANCHGVHHTAQLLPTGLDMYNKCFVCHQAGGAADPKINIGMHLADGSVDCGTCHSMHSFREEELYSTDHVGTKGFNLSFVRANMAKQLNTANGFPVDALEPTVFQNRPADFAFQSTDPPYNAVCQTCHSDDAKTSHHQQDATDDHQFGNDCITCHSHRNTDEYNAFKASSHPVDFGKDAACTVCHDPAGTKNVLNDIHGNGTVATCSLCHSGSPTRNNEKLGDNGLGDARNADGTAAGGTWASQTCLTCHDVADPDINPPIATVGDMHHGHTDATGGNCVACHMPNVGAQSPLANRSDIMMPANLACNFCHLWWPNNTDYINQAADNGYDTATVAGKVMIYRLTFDPVTNQRMMATIAPLTSHAISTNAVTPVNDYGACLACHGATGVDNGRADAAGQADMIRPFHGLGQPVTSAVAVTVTGSNADFTRHVNNFFAGPQQTTSNAPVKTVPYNPGYAAFNFLALDVGTNQGGGTKPYATDDNTYKFIHDSERNIRGIACRNTTIGSTSTSIEYNNWGADLGAVGNITVNTGGVEGATNKSTVLPLVNLSLPTNIGPQAGCP